MSDSTVQIESRPAAAAPLPGAVPLDPGLVGLVLIAAYFRIAADPVQLRHQLALTSETASAEDIVRGANLLGLKSRILRRVTPKRFAALPLPAIIGLKGGSFGCSPSAAPRTGSG